MQAQAQSDAPSTHSEKAMSRYTDAYRVAKVIVGMGDFVKGFGLIAATIVGLLGLGLYSNPSNQAGIIASLVVAVAIGVFFWVLGVLVAAQGQMLKATLDDAVHTSPFLVDEQRAKVMSLS